MAVYLEIMLGSGVSVTYKLFYSCGRELIKKSLK